MKANLFFITMGVAYIIFMFVFLHRLEKKANPPVKSSMYFPTSLLGRRGVV